MIEDDVLRIFKVSIDEVDITARLGGSLKAAGIKTWFEVVWFGDALLLIPNLGRRSLNEAKEIVYHNWPKWYDHWGFGGRDHPFVCLRAKWT